jgi:glycine/D-amino acid oxidase-like deaminating enzyme
MARPDADVLVIGGGITGTAAAIALAEAGARVTVVDAGVNAGSTANAGSLHVQMQSRFMRLYPDQVPIVEAALPFYSAAANLWVRLDQRHGPFELVREGGLMLAEGADQLAFLEAKAKREAAHGLSVEMLDRAALDRIAPWLGPQIVGAELCRDEGKLNPLAANARLRAKADALGVAFVTDTIVRLDPSARRISAHGAAGRYDAEQAILAAAWGAGDLLLGLGLTIPTRAEPLHMNITEPGAPAIRHLVQHAERSITLKQFASGQIVIGGGWPADAPKHGAAPKVRADSLLGNVGLAARLAPAISALRVTRTWAGLNTTIDGASVIGRHPNADRIVLSLPGDAGYTLGPLVAQCAAAIALGATPMQDVGRFTPARFAT